MLSALNKLNKWIYKFVDLLIIFLMTTLVIIIFFQVLNRFILHIPAAWTEEMGRYNFVWLTLFGSTKALKMNSHMSVEILVDSLTPKLKKYANYFIELVIMAFSLLLFKTGLDYTIANLGVSCEFGHLPISIIYVGLPITGILFFLYSFEDFLKLIIPMKAGEES